MKLMSLSHNLCLPQLVPPSTICNKNHIENQETIHVPTAIRNFPTKAACQDTFQAHILMLHQGEDQYGVTYVMKGKEIITVEGNVILCI